MQAENHGARRILVGGYLWPGRRRAAPCRPFHRMFDAALVCAHVDLGTIRRGGTARRNRRLLLDPDLPELKDTDSIKGWWPRSVQRSLTIPLNCPFESWQATLRMRSPGWPTSSMSR